MRSAAFLAVPAIVVMLAAPAWADVFCPKCGNRYPDSYRYCPKDGFDLDVARREAGAGGSKDAAKPAAKEDWPASPETGKAPAEEDRPPSPYAAAKKTDAEKDVAIVATAEEWAADLPVHLPAVYPDANVGDFALFEWTTGKPGETALFLRTVLRKGEKGHVSVLATDLPWPRKSSKEKAPPLQEILERVGPDNS